jgi:hypothetical protein
MLFPHLLASVTELIKQATTAGGGVVPVPIPSFLHETVNNSAITRQVYPSG